MHHRLSIGICLATLGLAACHSVSEPGRTEEVGVIEMAGERSGVLVAPETARAGADFSVTVRTFGNGCVTAAGTGVRYDGATAILTPYDNSVARSRSNVNCPDILIRPLHAVALRFPVPGPVTVRVEGRSEPGGQAASVETTVTLTPP